MRGFPLLTLLFTLFTGGGILLPLVLQVTQENAVPEMTGPVVSGAEEIRAFVQVRCLPPADTVSLISGGRTLHIWTSGEARLEETIQLPLAENRTEVQVLIKWPPGTTAGVAEIRLEPDGLAAWSTTLWADGDTADEFLSIPWRKSDSP